MKLLFKQFLLFYLLSCIYCKTVERKLFGELLAEKQYMYNPNKDANENCNDDDDNNDDPYYEVNNYYKNHTDYNNNTNENLSFGLLPFLQQFPIILTKITSKCENCNISYINQRDTIYNGIGVGMPSTTTTPAYDIRNP